MGFTTPADRLLENVRAAEFPKKGGILGINIGKNATTPIEKAADDYLICLEKVYNDASYVTVNISSPNTKNLRELQKDDALDDLLAQLKAKQEQLAENYGKYVPMALKIAPDLDDTPDHRDRRRGCAATAVDGGSPPTPRCPATASKIWPTATKRAACPARRSSANRPSAEKALHRAARRTADHRRRRHNGGEDAARKSVPGPAWSVLQRFIYRGPDLVGEVAETWPVSAENRLNPSRARLFALLQKPDYSHSNRLKL